MNNNIQMPDILSNVVRSNVGMNVRDRFIKNVKNGDIIPEDQFYNGNGIFDWVSSKTTKVLEGKTSEQIQKEEQEDYTITELSKWQIHKNKIIIGGSILLVAGLGVLIYKKYNK